MEFKDKIRKLWKYISTRDSVGWAREYDFYLFFCKSENGNCPWSLDVWYQQIEPLINSIIIQSPEYKNTALRVFKYDKPNEHEYYRELKLGRLRWNKKSHDKWTEGNENDNYFESLELWTPIWTQCNKKQLPPDIYFKIENEEFLYKEKKLDFNVFITLAIAKDLKLNCNELIVKLSEKLYSLETVYHGRRWNKPPKDKNENWTFSNWIQDTISNGIYRKKSLHDFKWDEIVFDPSYWQIIYKKLPNIENQYY